MDDVYIIMCSFKDSCVTLDIEQSDRKISSVVVPNDDVSLLCMRLNY